jgi:hypothetical protein
MINDVFTFLALCRNISSEIGSNNKINKKHAILDARTIHDMVQIGDRDCNTGKPVTVNTGKFTKIAIKIYRYYR